MGIKELNKYVRQNRQQKRFQAENTVGIKQYFLEWILTVYCTCTNNSEILGFVCIYDFPITMWGYCTLELGTARFGSGQRSFISQTGLGKFSNLDLHVCDMEMN